MSRNPMARALSRPLYRQRVINHRRPDMRFTDEQQAWLDARASARAEDAEREDVERADRILASIGKRAEDIRTERNDYAGAPGWALWHAWVDSYDSGQTVGSGSTPEAAIEDFLDQVER